MYRSKVLAILSLAAVAAFAQQGRRGASPPAGSNEAPPPGAPAAPPAESAPQAVEKFSKTQHTIHAAGSELAYTATAGTLVLRREDGKAKASIFFIAYTLDSAADKSRRPLTFSFNGGPGSSSVSTRRMPPSSPRASRCCAWRRRSSCSTACRA